MRVNWFRALVLVAAVGMLPAMGAAQTSDQTTRGLKLSPSQREAIYQSVSKAQKNNTAPIGFRPSVGSVVPKGIDLAPLPDTLGEMIPEARGYEVTMVEKQILLVDPGSKVVIALMTGEEASRRVFVNRDNIAIASCMIAKTLFSSLGALSVFSYC